MYPWLSTMSTIQNGILLQIFSLINENILSFKATHPCWLWLKVLSKTWSCKGPASCNAMRGERKSQKLSLHNRKAAPLLLWAKSVRPSGHYPTLRIFIKIQDCKLLKVQLSMLNEWVRANRSENFDPHSESLITFFLWCQKSYTLQKKLSLHFKSIM